MINEQVQKEYRKEVLSKPKLYPELYALEVKRNNYLMFGNIYGWRR